MAREPNLLDCWTAFQTACVILDAQILKSVIDKRRLVLKHPTASPKSCQIIDCIRNCRCLHMMTRILFLSGLPEE